MLIALVGTPAAGKADVKAYLLRKGFSSLSLQTPNSPQDTNTTAFSSPDDLLEFATRNWQTNFVTTDLRTYRDIDPFLKRPFFLVVAVDAPIRVRYERQRRREP